MPVCGSINSAPRQRNLFESEISKSSNEVDAGSRQECEVGCDGVIQSPNRLAAQDRNSCTQLERWKLTPTQVKVVELYRKHGGPTAVAKELGIALDTVRKHLVEARVRLGKTHCRQLLSGTKYEGKRHRNESSVTQTNLLRLIESQDYRCALTGVELTPETAALDHKIPRSMGGENEIGNVWFVLASVNKAKGTMSTEQFIELCRLVVAHADATRPIEGSFRQE